MFCQEELDHTLAKSWSNDEMLLSYLSVSEAEALHEQFWISQMLHQALIFAWTQQILIAFNPAGSCIHFHIYASITIPSSH